MEIQIENLVNQFIRTCEADPLKRIANQIAPGTKGHYPYIASASYHMLELIRAMQKDKLDLREKSFIDAGCGYPMVPRLMSMFGADANGLEFNPALVAMFSKEKVIQGDILEYDFSPHDVIYAYNPLCDSKLMIEGLKNIMKTMKKGAIFYFVSVGNTQQSVKGFVQTRRDINLYRYIKK